MNVAPGVEPTPSSNVSDAADELVLEPPKAVGAITLEQAAGKIKVDDETAARINAAVEPTSSRSPTSKPNRPSSSGRSRRSAAWATMRSAARLKRPAASSIDRPRR